jgi:tetratricopeptide (TPR) repeat protein
MQKILKKYTTIPSHLYVNRDADTQLKKIIEDMQRPGYVLVARQMGKTNLLFNAKRTLETGNRLFAYVDLSNLYDHERECYRNIINNIIDPHLSIFESFSDTIEKIRQRALPPHNEYSRSLIAILNEYHGDLVIVLDEIDALKSVPYSDNIFAQIRSNYFSRTSYPVFERLTYVLSGVIEPTELIKDGNKSPFNIGDKIYLDDFSKSEHDDFVKRSQLAISQDLSDEIYNWANGNPRLTFDICSDIESFLMDNAALYKSDISQILTKKYLTNFDIAPIDHIRELVKSNKQIRKSITQIHKGKSSDISDEIKKKLYLYGIINSKFNEVTKIKNKIISLSLSDDWIKSIDRLSTDNFNLGLEKMDDGDYSEAIILLNEFLTNSEPSKNQVDICNYNIGFAYYNLGELEDALRYFSLEFSIEQYVRNSKSLNGICHLVVGPSEKGVSILEEVVSEGYNNFGYRNALLNLANHFNKNGDDRALSLYEKLFESTFEPLDEVSEGDLMQLRVLSLYYQASNLRRDSVLAISKIDEALSHSSKAESLFLIYYKGLLQNNYDSALKSRLVSEILDISFGLEERQLYPTSFTRANLLKYIDFVFDENDSTLFKNLVDFVARNLILDRSEVEIIYEVSTVTIGDREELLNYLVSCNPPSDLLIKIYRDWAFLQTNNLRRYLELFENYKNLFELRDSVSADDIYLFALCIKYNSDIGRIKRALDLCEILDDRFHEGLEDDLKFEYTIIYYWFATLYFGLKNKQNSLNYANKALDCIDLSVHKGTSMMDEKGLSSIREQLISIKKSSTVYMPITVGRKYGRNDRIKVRYLDGRIVEKKFKYIEADLIADRCKVI